MIINQAVAHLLIIGNAWEQNKKEQAVVEKKKKWNVDQSMIYLVFMIARSQNRN